MSDETLKRSQELAEMLRGMLGKRPGFWHAVTIDRTRAGVLCVVVSEQGGKELREKGREISGMVQI